MTLEPDKATCSACLWRGRVSEILRAPNPFDKAGEIQGCPRCKTIDRTERVCDEPGCWLPTSGGTPIPGGYRFTCFNHRPRV